MFYFKVNNRHELRILQPLYANELFSITDSNRSYLRRWLPWLDSIKSCSDTLLFIESTMQQFADKQGFVAGIWYDDSCIGVIGYDSIDWTNRSTYIGYWLIESQQGKGIMTDSCRVFVDYAFNSLKLHRVSIACANDNNRSKSIAQNLGFTLDGTLHEAAWLYDHYVDITIYSQLQHKWLHAG